MSKELFVSSTPHETKLAILEDDLLTEVYFERENEYTLAGSIYKGRVTRVLPGMQSAFVDIGLERDAFLYVTDFLEETEDREEFDQVISRAHVEANESLTIEPASGGIQKSQAEDATGPALASVDDKVDEYAKQSGVELPASQGEQAASAPESNVEGGSRRWRGRRGRRGRGPRNGAPPKPASSFPAPDAIREPAKIEPAPPQIQSRERSGERPSSKFSSPPANYQPIILPGESISKYKKLAETQPAPPPSEHGSNKSAEANSFPATQAVAGDDTQTALSGAENTTSSVSRGTNDTDPSGNRETRAHLASETIPSVASPADSLSLQQDRAPERGASNHHAEGSRLPKAEPAHPQAPPPFATSSHAEAQHAQAMHSEARNSQGTDSEDSHPAGHPDHAHSNDVNAQDFKGGAESMQPAIDATDDATGKEGTRQARAAHTEPEPRTGIAAHFATPAVEEEFHEEDEIDNDEDENGEISLYEDDLEDGALYEFEEETLAGDVRSKAASEPGRLPIAAGSVQETTHRTNRDEPSDADLEGEGFKTEEEEDEENPQFPAVRGGEPGLGSSLDLENAGSEGAGEIAGQTESQIQDRNQTTARNQDHAEVRASSGVAGFQQRTDRGTQYRDKNVKRGNGHIMRGRGRRNVPRGPMPVISDLLKEGQEILVQIAKEPIAKKGARITSHIALPGRFLVFMPTVNHTGVSRKIVSEEERQRLKRILISERGTMHGGFIVRTAAAGASEEELRADIRFLINLWVEIRSRAESGKSPALIYHDLNLVERILRDQVTQTYSQIWVDTEQEYERILRFVSRFQPSLVKRVKLYTKETPLFEQFNIQEEINKALKSKVWLKSGGSIVINQTEALVAIDINTGKYVGKTARLEDTIVKTNVDAIKEIVRQIRLRDLGGIIVIDFIDMDERKNRNKVMQALEEALKSDRAPSKVLQFNDFGLVAITRKRVKQSLERTLGTSCEDCSGTGMVKSVTTVCNEIYVEMRKMAKHFERQEVVLRAHPEVVKALKSNGGKWLQEMEELTGRTIIAKSDPTQHQEQFDIQ